MKFDYAIFHKNCLDGYSSLFVFLQSNKIAPNMFIYPDVPSSNNTPPNIKGKRVIIMDVAYKLEVLEKIFELAAHVVFIDHHDSIRNDVLNLSTKYPHTEIIYDESRSGASLTWKYLFPNKSIPFFIKYIQDNDTGTWKLKYTKYFILGLQVNYSLDLSKTTLNKWKQLFDPGHVKYLITKGKKYSEYQEYLLDSNSKRYTLESFPSPKIFAEFANSNVFTKPGQYRVAVINGSGCPSGSLLGNMIVEYVNCDFCILWTLHMDKKEYVLSFRSKTVDVGSIAKLFGGGGHKLASACSIPIKNYQITELFGPSSLPRN